MVWMTRASAVLSLAGVFLAENEETSAVRSRISSKLICFHVIFSILTLQLFNLRRFTPRVSPRLGLRVYLIYTVSWCVPYIYRILVCTLYIPYLVIFLASINKPRCHVRLFPSEQKKEHSRDLFVFVSFRRPSEPWICCLFVFALACEAW